MNVKGIVIEIWCKEELKEMHRENPKAQQNK